MCQLTKKNMLSVLGIEENKEVDQGRLEIQPWSISKNGLGHLEYGRHCSEADPLPTFYLCCSIRFSKSGIGRFTLISMELPFYSN